MRTASIITLLAIALLIPPPAQAEFYRYTDEHGNVIFTDDLSNIPADKREQAKFYQGSDASSPPAPESIGTSTSEQDRTGVSDNLDALKQEGERLEDLRDQLDQEYNALAEENSRLKEEQKQAATPDQIKAVNKKVVSFNARFKAYQEKSEAYKAQLDAYNQRVEAAEAKQP